MEEFRFSPASFLPVRDKAVLDKCRGIGREEMEYVNEHGFAVKVVPDPMYLFVADCFLRIKESDEQDKPLTMIFPNQWPEAYRSVAELCNMHDVSCRNVHAFAMDEWADEDGNVAPLSFGPGLGYSFRTHFYGSIREDLRPDVEHWHVLTTRNVNDYSKIIEDVGDGGADVCYSATGWPGHIAFIDPQTKEFAAGSLEEFLTLGSRIVTQHPLTIAENSLFPPMGAAGDVYAVPPRAATIGPRDVAHARDHFEIQNITFLGGDSWQKMVSRLTLYGPVSMDCPSSILQLFPGTAYVSEAIAKPFSCWYNGQNVFV
jgi:6-phosphogluconolactonase/glucosamine-6-phosphate isomerase/deaminase